MSLSSSHHRLTGHVASPSSSSLKDEKAMAVPCFRKRSLLTGIWSSFGHRFGSNNNIHNSNSIRCLVFLPHDPTEVEVEDSDENDNVAPTTTDYYKDLSSVDDSTETSDEPDDEPLNFMISHLSLEDLEIAARTNYEYLRSCLDGCDSVSQRATNRKLKKEDPIPYVRLMCRRYLISKNYNKYVALEKVQATIYFRRELMNIEELITAFDSYHGINSKSKSSNNSMKGNKIAEKLHYHLKSKHMYVQGYDKSNRATFLFIPRNVTGHDPEWTIKEALYTIERAIACSKAKDKTINAMVDFTGFSSSRHAPPISIGQAFVSTLRKYYAGQVHRIYLIDAPSSFNFLWRILKPFVGTNTRSKIQFISSRNSHHQQLIRDMYDAADVPSWVLPDGKKNRELDIDEYLYKIPFDQAFDSSPLIK